VAAAAAAVAAATAVDPVAAAAVAAAAVATAATAAASAIDPAAAAAATATIDPAAAATACSRTLLLVLYKKYCVSLVLQVLKAVTREKRSAGQCLENAHSDRLLDKQLTAQVSTSTLNYWACCIWH